MLRSPLCTHKDDTPRNGEKYVPVDYTQFQLVNDLIRRNAKIRAAFEVLRHHIFAGGVIVSKPGFKVTSQIQLELDTTWKNFFEQLMLSVFSYGFVVVRLVDGYTPICISPLDLKIELVLFEDGHRQMRLRQFSEDGSLGWNLKNNKPWNRVITDVMIFARDAPDNSGNLSSISPCLLLSTTVLNMFMHYAVRAAARSAMPTVFLEHVPESPEMKQLSRDVAAPGNSNAMHEAEIERSSAFDVRSATNEAPRNRQAALIDGPPPSTSGPGGYGSTYDGAGFRYPGDEWGLPWNNVQISLPQGRRLVQNTPSEPPYFLTELEQKVDQEIARVTGVPTGMFGGSGDRSNIAANITTMNIFYATQQHYRQILQTVGKQLMMLVYGKEHLQHMIDVTDPSTVQTEEDVQRVIADHDFQLSFPGLLDPEVLQMLQDRGAMEWDTWCEYTSRYFGIPREHLSKKQLDVATDRPLEEVMEEEQEHETEVMKLQSELKINEMDAKPVPAGAKKRRTPMASAETRNGAKTGGSTGAKRQKTRTQNVKKASSRTKRPGNNTAK